MSITRRHLLQWAPSSEVERSARSGNAAHNANGDHHATAAIANAALHAAPAISCCSALPLGLAWMAAPWLMAWLGEQPAAPVA
ncbi:hypothetical protein XarbCFBP8150_21350, partial [Xanthomonas arboricola]